MAVSCSGVSALFWKTPITPGNLASWAEPGVLQDAGGSFVVVTLTLDDPTAAAANTAAINAALATRGTVWLAGNGVAYINANLIMFSSTSLQILMGLTLRPVAGTGAVIVNNAALAAWTTLYNVSGVITSGPLSLIWNKNTPAWTAATAYSLGNYVTNGGNIYWCSQAGTSAGAGGPTGTGSNIVDNTVRWNYVTVAVTDTNSAFMYVAINYPAHGRSVGDSIWITPQPDTGASNIWTGTQAAHTRGGPCDSAYFGVFRVVQVNDANWLTVAAYRSPTQAFSGIPMNIKQADQSIVLGGGGTIDFNFPTNGHHAPEYINAHAVVFAGVKGLVIDDLNVINVEKYCLCLGGVADYHINELNSAYSSSDRIKVYGPAFSGNIANSHGRNGDDGISLHPQESSVFSQYIIACGDVLDVSVEHISTDGDQKPLTIFAQHAQLQLDNVTFEHVGGVWIGGQVTIFGSSSAPIGVVNIRNVSNRGLTEPVIAVGGTTYTIRELNIEQCVKNPVDSSLATGQLLAIDSNAVIDAINVKDCSGVIYGSYVQVFNGTVKLLNIDGGVINFPTLTGSAAVVQQSSTCVVNQVNLSNLSVLGNPNYVVAVAGTTIVNLDNIYAPDMTTQVVFVTGAGVAQVSARGVQAPNAAFGLIGFGNTSTAKVFSGGGNILATWFSFGAAGLVEPYGYDIRVDVAKATHAVGTYCYNTNAASSPVGVTGPTTYNSNWCLIGDDANGVGVLVANSTNHWFLGVLKTVNEYGFYDITNDKTTFVTGYTGGLPLNITSASGAFGWNTNANYASTSNWDTALWRDASGIIAQRNGTNAQAFRAYNTYSSAGVNYERGIFDWQGSANVLTIGTENAGSGVERPLRVVVGGTNRLDYNVTASNVWCIPTSGSSYFGNGGGLVLGNGGTTTGVFPGFRINAPAANNAGPFCVFTINNTDVCYFGTKTGVEGGSRSDVLEFIALNTTATSGDIVFKASGPSGGSGGGYAYFTKGSGAVALAINTFTTVTGFGGTSSSFPGLKNSGAQLQVRLADDSGYANLTSAVFVATGGSTRDVLTVTGTNAADTNFIIENTSPSGKKYSFSSTGGSSGFGAGKFVAYDFTDDETAFYYDYPNKLLALSVNTTFCWGSDKYGLTPDLGISRSAAGVVAFGNASAGDASATIKAKTKAGAPGTGDVPAGTWALIRDTSGATTKIYYNNAGALQSVALV